MSKKHIIIGAGILGASTAYYLAKSGAEVVVIDRKDKGQATDAAAGIICPWLSQRRNKAWYRLAKNGARIYHDLITDLANDGETDTGYSRVGAISIHTEEKKLLAMQERALKRREEAPEIGDVILQDATKTKSMFPLLSDAYSSVYVSGAARVDGRKLRDSLLRAAQKHGAQIMQGNARILEKNHQVIGVSVEEDAIYADCVIAATGAWMNELFHPLGLDFKVQGQRAQIIHLEMPDMDTSKWPVVMPPTNKYMLAFNQNRIVIGSTHEDDVGFDWRVTVGGVHEILDKAIGFAPELSNATILETRVGFRPFTPGFLPVLGPVPGYKGILFANGLGASGLTMGPFIGQQLAKIANNAPPDINLEEYGAEYGACHSPNFVEKK